MPLFLTGIGKGRAKKKTERDKERGGNRDGKVIAGSRIGFSNGAGLAIVNPFTLEFNHHKTLSSLWRREEEREERIVFHLHLTIAGPLK